MGQNEIGIAKGNGISDTRLSDAQAIRVLHCVARGQTVAEIAEYIRAPVEAVELHLASHALACAGADDSARLAVVREKRNAALAAWRDKVSLESAALSSEAFALVRDKIDTKDARGFNDAARGLNTMVQLTRQAEGLDSGAKGETSSLAVYVIRVGEGGVTDTRPLKQVEQVNELPPPDPDFG
jgi:hypothetical protein